MTNAIVSDEELAIQAMRWLSEGAPFPEQQLIEYENDPDFGFYLWEGIELPGWTFAQTGANSKDEREKCPKCDSNKGELQYGTWVPQWYHDIGADRRRSITFKIGDIFCEPFTAVVCYFLCYDCHEYSRK